MGKKKRKTEQARVNEILDIHPNETSPWRIFKIMTEFVTGFDFLKQYDKAISIFGSTRFKHQSRYYQEAEKLSRYFSEAGFAIITGGGPGIMEAANKGAYETKGQSIGLNIELPDIQRKNKYVKESESFHYFFVRKVMLSFASEIYVFFPGGFGTLDEFSEIVTLVQTKKINPVPIILIGKDYWQPLLSWIKETMYEKNATIDREDMNIYHLVDNAEEAWQLSKKIMKEHRLERSDVQNN